MNINNFKIIKKLGSGIVGTVYLAEYESKQYALKIEHILEEDIKDKSSQVWNEIRFAKDIGNKNPMHFMTLYDYDIIDKCELKQEYPIDIGILSEPVQKQLKQLADSEFCVRKVYSLVDTTLSKIEFQNLEEVYSMIVQMMYIIHLMEKKGYVHADLHPGNVGVLNTDEEFVNVLKYTVPTFGKIYQAIDFGGVLNVKTLNPKKKIMGTNETQKDVYEWAKFGDKLGPMLSLIDDSEFWEYVNTNEIKLDQETDKKKVLKAPEMKFINSLLNSKFSAIKYNDLKFEFFRIMFPEVFQKIVLGEYFDKVRKPKLKIPIEDFIIFFVNFEDTKLLIDYFATKLINYSNN